MASGVYYSVTCECGHELRVTAGDAGTSIGCRCGRNVQVPTLGKLARASGKPIDVFSPAERIQHLVAAGKLPSGAVCARCQFPTDGVLECSVECERPLVMGRSFWQTALMILIAPYWLIALLNREHGHPEVHGRELVVKMPVRMCPDCQGLFHGNSRLGELRTLLRSVPEFDALFAQYPNASLLVLQQLRVH